MKKSKFEKKMAKLNKKRDERAVWMPGKTLEEEMDELRARIEDLEVLIQKIAKKS